MLTYQDYLQVKDSPDRTADFVRRVLNEHRASDAYHTALDADEYDAQRNVGIRTAVKTIIGGNGQQISDTISASNRLESNFFARLNTQRCTYSLGNGLTFQDKAIKKKLGYGADKTVKDAGYFALIHGESFLYWAYDHLHLFKLTEFAPIVDEKTDGLGAGVRFWQIDPKKPLYATLYTPEGYIDYIAAKGDASALQAAGELRPYRMTVSSTPATTGDVETAHNYTALPIVPLHGSRLRQSTLVGMRSKIDAFDFILSGFADDIHDCAQIYMLISGAGGMTEKDLEKFRDRLLHRHIASVPGADDGVSIQPYTQDIPYEARDRLMQDLRAQIYEDFGGLDVHTVAAGATNDHIDAGYQPMDENADDFEFQVTTAMQSLLGLLGVPQDAAEPQYKRNRLSNQREQVEMLLMEAPYLDDETLLKKFPNISSEEVEEIMKRKAAEALDRVSEAVEEEPESEDEEKQDENSDLQGLRV